VNRSGFRNGSPTEGRNVSNPIIKSMLRAMWGGLLCTLAMLLASPTPAIAQAGKLDPTFGTNGIFVTNLISCCSAPIDNAVALQSDGKIVVGGQVGSTSGPLGALVRLTTNGSLDSSFGAGGLATSKFDNIRSPMVVGLAIQPDGKILAAATGTVIGGFRVGRFNKDGSLDTTFGINGFASTSGVVDAGPLVLQSDGKILVAGDEFGAFTGTGLLVRFDSNGQLDATFGADGIAVLLANSPAAVTLQSDGKILVGSGASFPPGVIGAELGPVGPGAGSLARYDVDGSLDKSFGIAGQVATLVAPFAISVQSDGKILATGSTVTALVLGGNHSGFGLVRLNANGIVDTTFGTHGGTAAGFPNTTLGGALGMALQLNGDIVLAGEAGNINPFAMSFALARYTGTGNLDPMFGTEGIVTTSFNSSPVNWISRVVIQTDGKIVVAGSAQGQIAVARYLAQ